MAKYRIMLALTAWLFAWSIWSFVIAKLIGGHAFRGATSSVMVELTQNRDAVYAGAWRFTPVRPTLRYIWGSESEHWAYLMAAIGRNEWPHWSGFQFVADAPPDGAELSYEFQNVNAGDPWELTDHRRPSCIAEPR